jgi:anti-sigma factor RsiW
VACAEAARVHAYLDGELEPAATAAIERHIERCEDCGALQRDIEAVRAAVRGAATHHHAGPELKAAIGLLLKREATAAEVRRPPLAATLLRGWHFWAGAATGGAVIGVTVAALLFVGLPTAVSPLVADVVNAHLRSLVSEHLIDVESSDRHTVKPWFAGHADVSPPVADFPRENFHLAGGRADYVAGKRTAVVVYRHGPHVINVFTWPDSGNRLPAKIVSRNGYHLVFWKNGDLVSCAVSDTAIDELLDLSHLLAALSTPDSRE